MDFHRTLLGWCVIVCCAGVCGRIATAAEPTAVREWRSTAGTSLQAKATGLSGTSVRLETPQGRVVALDLDRLSEADQVFLRKHFGSSAGPPEAEPVGSGANPAKLLYPLGAINPEVTAEGGVRYHVYLPKTLKEGRQYPLMFHSEATGGGPHVIKAMKAGAEIGQCIIVSTRNYKNGISGPLEVNCKADLKHLAETLPVDKDRIFFAGNSGGAAFAYFMANEYPSAGVFAQNGHSGDDYDLPGFHFILNGAKDYNRYNSAWALAKFGRRAVQRYHEGGHTPAPTWLLDEGIIWMNLQVLGAKQRAYSAEAEDAAALCLGWIQKMKAKEPHRAYAWTNYLREVLKLSAPNQKIADGLMSELAADKNNLLYVEALNDFDELARKQFASLELGSAYGHVTPQITQQAARLAVKYQGVPWVETIATVLGGPTQPKPVGRKNKP